MAAIKHLKDAGLRLHVDFAVWGPHALRTARKPRLQGLVLGQDGQLFRSEINGPPTFALWDACFAVFAPPPS